MSDPIINPAKPEIQALEQDALDTASEIMAVYKAYKSGGLKGVIGESGNIRTAVTKDIVDTKAALPVIKDGLKTSEFWLSSAACAALLLMTYKGFTIPPAISATIGGVVSLYAMFRTGAKKV